METYVNDFALSTAQAVLSAQAITDSVMFGQKLKAVVLEYPEEIDSDTLNVNAFTVLAHKGDNRTFAESTITAIYVNSNPCMVPDQSSRPGRYIVIEVDERDMVGLRVSEAFYYDSETPISLPWKRLNATPPYWLHSKEGYIEKGFEEIYPIVIQHEDIPLKNGTIVLGGAEEIRMTQKTINLYYDDFQDLTIPSQSNGTYCDGRIHAKYHLPKNYNKNEKYPLVVVQSGGGLFLEEIATSHGIVSNLGANIAFDSAAISWIRQTYEDVIVLAVHLRSLEELPEKIYDFPAEINQAVEYMINTYAVDADRVIYSGNSSGSLYGYATIGQRPDLWTAFMPCNGLSHLGEIDTPEGLAIYQEKIEKFMTPLAENRIAIIWQLGVNDFLASDVRGQMFYDFMQKYYQNVGLEEEEINSILQLNTYPDEEYINLGLVRKDGSADAHSATKLVYTRYQSSFMPWLLKHSKKTNMKLGAQK